MDKLITCTAAALTVLAQEEQERLAAVQAATDKEGRDKLPPVLLLGYENETMVLYSPLYQKTAKLLPNQLKRDYLLQLAPLDAWLKWIHPEKKASQIKDSTLFKDVQERLIVETGCRRYNSKKIHKLGIWKTKEGFIYNAGDACYLLPDGALNGSLPIPIAPMRPDGSLFEMGEELPHLAAASLTDAEARLIKDYIAAHNWTEPYAAELLAGWIPCAVLGGVLKYRPHIWINAERGCGKSTLCKNIGCMLGGDAEAAGNGGLAVIFAGASTTPAAFRRDMGNTTRAGIFDETEAETEKDRNHLANILAQIRLSIDGTASKICGGKNNAVEAQVMKSCYLLASIRNSLFKPADESRFVVLNMRKERDKNQLANMLSRQNAIRNQFPIDLAEKLITRCLQHASLLLANAAKIADTLLHYGLEGRASDKLGNLLAGAWLMEHATAVTPQYLEKCKTIAASALQSEQIESDGTRCLRILLDKTSPIRRRPIRELARCAALNASDEAKNELNRYGCVLVRYSGKKHQALDGKLFLRVFLSNPNFKAIFDDTDWHGGKVKKTLTTLEGVIETTARFMSGGIPEPCLMIPPYYWGSTPTEEIAEDSP